MNDVLTQIYQSHNDAAATGVAGAREKVASEYGAEGAEVFDQWLDQVPADQIFDLESSPEKVAEENDVDTEKLAEYDAIGRVMAHAFRQETQRLDKIAEYVGDKVHEAFLADCSESE